MTAPAFVPLEFPPWFRWGKRTGGKVDHAVFRATFPDARHSEPDGVDEKRGYPLRKYKLIGGPWRCGWCGRECGGRRTAWCSAECSKNFYRVWTFRDLSFYIAERDGFRCVRCEKDFNADGRYTEEHGQSNYRAWECDHIVPIRNGGTDDPMNLRTLCKDCHIAVGYEQRAAERPPAPPDPQLTLEVA